MSKSSPISLFFLYITLLSLFYLVLTNKVCTFRVFQNYELQMRDLQADRSYLADGFGEFLFNNDEYIWSPLETYYKKRLL